MIVPQIDYETLLKNAIEGDADSQCTLADIFADDSNTRFFDLQQAVHWYEKAAEQGHTKAQCMIGSCYSQGLGVDKDSEKAEFWLQKSAEAGYAEGQFTLGGNYFMKPDIVKAEYWLEEASKQGHMEARTALRQIRELM